MRSVVSHTLLVLCSLLFCFVVAEGITRLAIYFGSPSSLPLAEQLERSRFAEPISIKGTTTVAGLIQPSQFDDVVYELKPNIRAIFQGKPLSTNSSGFRDREYALEKPPGVFRIVGIGDSVMFGWGVNAEDSYLEVVERTLQEKLKSSVEVINAAIPGYNTAMEVALLDRKVKNFSPDLVVLHFVGNDFAVPLFMARHSDPKEVTRSYFLEFVRDRLVGFDPGKESSGALLGALDQLEHSEKQNVRRQYRYMLGQKGFRLAMSRLAAVTKARRIPVVVITGSKRKSVRGIAEKHGFYYTSVAPFVEKYIAAHMPSVDAEARRAALWVSPTDGHPNALGHALYAEALLDILQQKTIVSVEK